MRGAPSFGLVAGTPGVGIQQKANGFSLADFGSDLALWIESEDLAGLIDNDPISTLIARAGTSPTQTGTSRATYKTNILNGYPAIRFDGTNDYYATSAGTANAQTVILVAKRVSFISAGRYWGATPSRSVTDRTSGTLSYFANQSSINIEFGSNPTSGFVCIARQNSLTSTDIFFNSATAPTNLDPADVSGQTYSIGSSNISGSNPGNVDIFTFAVVNKALSANEVQSVLSLYGAKYGIVVS